MTKSRSVFFTILVLTVFALALGACASPSAPSAPVSPGDLTQQSQQVPVEGGGSYTDVSAVGLASMMENKDFPLINVHIPYAGEIEGTDLFIPFDEIEQNLDEMPSNKSARIVIYCRSGSMSATSARELVQLGYTDVWNLDGGMIGWKQVGYPLLDKGR
jgi:rhodanese-related sulfurtransferase